MKSLTCNLIWLDPIVCIPATYFIGESGLPLEVVGGSLPVDQFVTKAEKALEVKNYIKTACLSRLGYIMNSFTTRLKKIITH